MRQTIVIIDLSGNLGGAELISYRLVKYLSLKTDYDVVLVTIKNGLAKSILEKEGINFKCKLINKKFYIGYISARYMEEMKALGQEIIGNAKNVSVININFTGLQLALMLFAGKEIKILSAFMHPESWARELHTTPYSKPKEISSKKINDLWAYQRYLIKTKNIHNALWFLNDCEVKYNEYYYDVSISNSRIIPIPCDVYRKSAVVNNCSKSNDQKFSFLWVGRFAYFKNPSIKKVFYTLERLALKYDKVSIEFNLVGYGGEQHETEIKETIKSDIVKINYYGKVNPADLPNVIKAHNVGIAMGTSAIDLAAMGLPTIIIDAGDEKNRDLIKASWLYSAPVGYLGIGVYMDLVGFPTEGRVELEALLEQVIQNKVDLRETGKKCRAYVVSSYDSEVIIPKVVEAANASSFTPNHASVFRYPFVKRVLIGNRLTVKILKKLSNILFSYVVL